MHPLKDAAIYPLKDKIVKRIFVEGPLLGDKLFLEYPSFLYLPTPFKSPTRTNWHLSMEYSSKYYLNFLWIALLICFILYGGSMTNFFPKGAWPPN